MADMEVLAPGGHQHLVDKIEEQLDLKADAAMADAVKRVAENQSTATLTGDVLTASDAYAAPPMALTVDGRSTQDGTPTPSAPVPIVSVDSVELHASADGTTDYGNWPVTLYDGTLRSLPDGTRDTLALTYLRPSTREGWAWYSRELVQRVGYIADMVNLIWTHTTNRARSNSLANVIAIPARNVVPSILAEKYVPKAYSASVTNHPEYIQVTDAGELYSLYLDDIGTPTGELDYLLATPVTTTLDPIELPVLPAPDVTVWSDPTTGLNIEYVRDTEIVIDSLNAEIDRAHAAIAPVEHGTSSANYAVCSYLMLDGTFCKVTSAIATGENIAIGTNVVATTVDAELASLA